METPLQPHYAWYDASYMTSWLYLKDPICLWTHTRSYPGDSHCPWWLGWIKQSVFQIRLDPSDLSYNKLFPRFIMCIKRHSTLLNLLWEPNSSSPLKSFSRHRVEAFQKALMSVDRARVRLDLAYSLRRLDRWPGMEQKGWYCWAEWEDGSLPKGTPEPRGWAEKGCLLGNCWGAEGQEDESKK